MPGAPVYQLPIQKEKLLSYGLIMIYILSKFLILKYEGIIKKISYDLCVYESVYDNLEPILGFSQS